MESPHSLPDPSRRSKKREEWSSCSNEKLKPSSCQLMGNRERFGSSIWEVEVPFNDAATSKMSNVYAFVHVRFDYVPALGKRSDNRARYDKSRSDGKW